MPRAFLIKSRASFPANDKKENHVDNNSRENGQATEVSSSFTEDSSNVNCVTSCPAQISPANVVVKKPYLRNEPGVVERDFATQEQQPFPSTYELSERTDNNAKAATRGRKRVIKLSYQQQTEFEQTPKKVRKGQPKKTVVYSYEAQNNEKSKVSDGDDITPVPKDDSTFQKNYTVEKRHYANERSRYHSQEHVSQSCGKSSDKFHHRKPTNTFAFQNDGKSLDRGKAPSTRKQSENNEYFDKNTGLDNVMIVEYHSMREQRENRLRNERNAQPIVTQQGYYQQPKTSTVVTSNYVPSSPVMTSAPPAQPPQPPRVAVQSIPRQETVKAPEAEPKVVYIPVYPVSQGPSGVIYEPIPNATPIMAKDTLQVRKVPQQGPPPPPPVQPQHVPEPPRPAPTVVQAVPQRQEVVMVNPSQPPPPEQKPRVEYRAYEPQMPQQLTAAPAPQTYQPHPQGHVIMQSQAVTPTTYVVAQVPPYAVRPSHPQQYPAPQNHQQPAQQHSYPPHQQQVSDPQPVTRGPDGLVHTYRPTAPVPQTYQERPPHYAPYPRPPQQAMHPQAYTERVIVQPVQPPPGPPSVSVQQPMYQRQERVSHGQPPRPPPLPSQPQQAEKPALPSPSYPQESANRLPTPRYTPDGPKHELKFVYAPPPADFMHSPVYRVPNNDENFPVYQHDRVDQNNNKTGSRKRKSSFPSHAVLQNKSEQLTNLPSPVESKSRTPSPKETDLMCNERLVKSPHHPSPLNKSSLIITPPVSPNERPDKDETVTVVVRDQGIQASPTRDEREERVLEHTCNRKSADSVPRRESFDEMYTEDGTVVVHIPSTDDNNNDDNNNNNVPKKQRSKKSNYRFVCKYCNKGFQWHSHLESHERTHTGEKPFKCPECERAFCRADGLQCHMLVHNKKRPFKCPHCGKGFTDKIVLEKHIYSHTGVKPFKCEYCGRAFSDSLSIEKHLLVHTGTKPYKCPYCVRSFNDSQMLVRHIRSHTGEKPYKCKNCPMAFSKQSALIIHTRVHTGEKPYQCPHCIKSFSISGNLQRHILIHTGERPYKCSKCPKAFNNPSHLSRHISKLHAPQNGTASKDQVKYEQFESENDSYYEYTSKNRDPENDEEKETYEQCQSSDNDSLDEPAPQEQLEYKRFHPSKTPRNGSDPEGQPKYKYFQPPSDSYYRPQEVM